MLRIGQVEATATQDGKYTDGSVAGGIAATRLRAAAFNAMQEELAHIVESAGLALDINDMTQVLKAIQKLTLSRANPFADIKSDGAAAISTALTNLGLGELVLAGTITGVFDTNGYMRIPAIIDGKRKVLIFQWMSISASATPSYYNLPIAWPSRGLHAFAVGQTGTDQATTASVFIETGWGDQQVFVKCINATGALQARGVSLFMIGL
ncbi:hypothetical protein ACO1Y9_13465 [Klebsiella quasipneumoniae]|uniref:hypothetical protein n=1 Tax=Klebsiella quasipneumoniae TaxID=1463165 RepID=UPI003BF65B1D